MAATIISFPEGGRPRRALGHGTATIMILPIVRIERPSLEVKREKRRGRRSRAEKITGESNGRADE